MLYQGIPKFFARSLEKIILGNPSYSLKAKLDLVPKKRGDFNPYNVFVSFILFGYLSLTFIDLF